MAKPVEFASLGFDLLEWMAKYLPSPRDENEPLILTDEQALVLIEWYRLDIDGRFVYRRGQSRRSKGWGKSPVQAAVMIAELAGAVVFDGWRSDGTPQGRPWGTGGLPPAQIQVAAVSEEQTDNTWMAAYHLLMANDGQPADELGIDAGLTRFFLRDRPGAAQPVTASAGSREGAPDTFAVLDETHLWTRQNRGTILAAVLRRNVGKLNGRSWETTNSFIPGEGSVAEGTFKAIERGVSGIMVDAVEAPEHINGVEVTEASTDADLKAALAVAYGESWWVDLDRLVQEIRDPDTKWSDAERFYFNWNRKGESKAVDPKRWLALIEPDRIVPAGARIGAGFDGSISEDATALIGCTEDGYSWPIRVWERPDGVAGKDWRVPRLEVHEQVAAMFAAYDVGVLYCDPPKWWTEIEQWQQLYGERVLALDTNGQQTKFARAVDRWLAGIKEGTHRHDGSDVMYRHVVAAHVKKIRLAADEADGRTLYVIVKGSDGRKIDAAVGDVLAYEAAMSMPPAKRKVVPWAAYDEDET